MNLNGKRVLITRPRKQAEAFAAALLAEGAQPVHFPVIQITSPEDYWDFDYALQQLESFDWLILTSVHGAEAFLKRLTALDIKRIPSELQVAAVGSMTAKCLSIHGIRTDYVPDVYLPEGILTGLGKTISGKHFLLPKSNLARTILADEIRNAGGYVREVVVYHTVPNDPDPVALSELRGGVDIVTFTSPSTVRNFVAVIQKNELDLSRLPGNPVVACIGPITRRAAEEAGLKNLITAREYTTTGLIEALKNFVYQ